MWKVIAVATFAVTFAGAAAAQSNPAPPPSALERAQNRPVPLRGPSETPSGVQSRGGGAVDLNSNSATVRGRREPGSGAMPQRLGPIAPGTGARDRGAPDSSTYNPGAPAIR